MTRDISIALFIAVFISLSSCGGGARLSGGRCAIDLDCEAPLICESGTCVVPPTGGCQKDTDCKGDRICVAGACTDPPPQPPADADASPMLDAASPDAINAGRADASDAADPVDAGVGEPAAQAVVKFCHQLLVDSVKVTLTMTVAGEQFPAFTGECSPCQGIPANQLLDFRILHPSGESLLDFQLALEPADWVFFGTVENDQATLRYGRVLAPTTCETADPFASPPP